MKPKKRTEKMLKFNKMLFYENKEFFIFYCICMHVGIYIYILLKLKVGDVKLKSIDIVNVSTKISQF